MNIFQSGKLTLLLEYDDRVELLELDLVTCPWFDTVASYGQHDFEYSLKGVAHPNGYDVTPKDISPGVW